MVIFLNEKHFICDINFSEILTEECITEVKKLGKIYVYGGEGQIPHFSYCIQK